MNIIDKLPAVGLAAGLALAVTSVAQAKDVVVAHYCALLQGAPWSVALEQDMFAKAGVDIDGIIPARGGGDTVRNALANDVPYGEAGLGAVLAARAKGAPLKVIHAAVSGKVDMYWLVRMDSPIQSIKDMPGKKMGITNPNSGSDQLTRQVLQAAGMSVDDVTIVTTGGLREGLTLLGQGEIDTMPAIEPIVTQLAAKFRPVFAVGDFVPTMTQTVGFTTEAFAKAEPDMLRKVIAARRQAVEAIYADPKAAAAMIAKRCEMKPELTAAVIEKFAGWRYWSTGGFDRAGLEANVAGLKLIGALKADESVDWSAVIDQSLLPEDLRKPL
ncbi:MAG: ABC transporter substrate-binding protein [Alphaproteobacteria bacterium]